MSHDYRVVQWTPFKKAYDAMLVIGIIVFLAAYVGAAFLVTRPDERPSEIQLLIRAFGACAFALLNLILAIGPMARLSRRFLPLLYNRRHLGVACFLIALVHASLAVLWYHGFSDLNPFISLLTTNSSYDSIQGFPFESLGLVALVILFVMAATSHDFWNANLGPGVWKAIHMSVYAAHVLLVAHVMLGAIQDEKSPYYAIVVGFGAAFVATLHIVSARIRPADALKDMKRAGEGWLLVGAPSEIADGRARIVEPPRGERIAVFRDGDRIYAISNVCRHQGGPLGEGRIIDGCVTCPWHGFQYKPDTGCAPSPFSEQVTTYRTRIEDGMIYVAIEPQPKGVLTPPSLISGGPA